MLRKNLSKFNDLLKNTKFVVPTGRFLKIQDIDL